MRAGLGVVLVGLVVCVGCQLGPNAGEYRPTPDKVIDAIKKLRGNVEVDKNKAVVSVRLAGYQIYDSELLHLKGLTNLKKLSLRSTKVTDAGLVHLKGLTNLQTLILSGTEVTEAGFKKLRQALPKCVIY